MKLWILAAFSCAADPAQSFCGFYVAKADAKLFNQASRVVLVRDGDRTVLTMANDYKGELKEFALVVPVPTVLERGQIHVAEPGLLEHLDAYTAPRLVEYFDPDPCAVAQLEERSWGGLNASKAVRKPGAAAPSHDLGVRIEAQYTVGEYDILILSARESDGLERWLTQNDYRVPAGASRVLGGYLKQDMKFFVARVNLKEQGKLGFTNLRPLQMAYESPKFMLPIRLGMVNADGAQELFVYALTRTGRVETTNYRTVRLPTGAEIPPYVKNEFPDFYRAMFTEQVRRENLRAVFLEYAWDMGWCDPCAADPLSPGQLRQLGVFWLEDGAGRVPRPRGGGPTNVFVTRLHVRYDREHFPEDLVFQATSDRENFQGRFVLRHPWQGQGSCDRAGDYRRELRQRQETEIATLASLTGWSLDEIQRKAPLVDPGQEGAASAWWHGIWKD